MTQSAAPAAPVASVLVSVLVATVLGALWAAAPPWMALAADSMTKQLAFFNSNDKMIT